MEDDGEGEEIQVSFVCDVCQKTFGWKGNLIRHKKEVHQRGVEEASCDVCQQKVLKRYFHEHLRLQHGIKRSKECDLDGRIDCPCCPKKLRSLKGLRKHAQEEHGVRQEKEFLTFRDEAEFGVWRKSTEKDNVVSFVVRQGATKVQGKKKQIFHCNRSGKYVPRGRNLRAMKSQGSCKMGSYCTASIDVVYMESQVQVTYHKTHFGHDLGVSDLLHVRIPETDKQLIAGRLMEGASFEDVLEEIRGSNTVDRKALLEKRDLRNIITQFGLDKRQCELCEFNAADLASMKRHMSACHPQREDFWCSQCRYKGTSKFALRKHRLKYHPRIYERTKCLESTIVNGVTSPCDASFALCARLRNHLAKHHAIFAALERETYQCGSIEDFHSWKHGYETGTLSKYATRNKMQVAGKPARYRCTHSCVKHEDKDTRRLKSQGFRKFGQECTSEIRAELQEDGTVIVTVFPFHYGHETGVDSLHARVPAGERTAAKGKSVQGLSKKRIIQGMRNSTEAPGDVGARRSSKFNRRPLANVAHFSRAGTTGSASGAAYVADIDDSDNQCWEIDADDVQFSSVGELSVVRAPSGGRPSAPDASPATLKGAIAELQRLRSEVDDLRKRLQKNATAEEVQRAELLRVFTPRQADILVGSRARSDDWDAEDLQRAVALRRVLTRRQYEHLRTALRLPLPALRSAAASAQTDSEKRWLYRRLLDQRLVVGGGRSSGGGGDVLPRPPGELFVLRSMADAGLDVYDPEDLEYVTEEVVEDVDTEESLEEDGDIVEIDGVVLDQTVAEEAEVRWEDEEAVRVPHSRLVTVAIAPARQRPSRDVGLEDQST